MALQTLVVLVLLFIFTCLSLKTEINLPRLRMPVFRRPVSTLEIPR